MSTEERLRSYATTDDVPPLRMRADDVLVTARARIRKRRIRLAAAAGLASAVVFLGAAVALPHRDASPAPMGPPPSPTRSATPVACKVERLPEPPGVDPGRRIVVGIDPSGRYVIGAYQPAANTPTGLLIWTDGVASRPAAAASFTPVAVNTQGVVIGVAPDHGQNAAAVFRQGKVSLLPRPAGADLSRVRAVNARGDVVGTVSGNTLPRFGDSVEELPILWPASGGFVMLSSHTEGLWPFTADAIGDDGVVLGTVRNKAGNWPYRWNTDGTGDTLPLPTTADGRRGVTAMAGQWAIGTAGELATQRSTAPSPRIPGTPLAEAANVRWNLAGGAVDGLGTLVPLGISATGRIVGGTDQFDLGPAVWQDGTVTPLPTVDPSRPVLRYGSITADGRTIVGALAAGFSGPFDLVRWTC